MNDYTLEYTLDGKVVDKIDTYISGRYDVYAKATIDGKEVRKLVYTFDVVDRYVEAFEVEDNNYSVLIISVSLGLIFMASLIFIVRKRIKKANIFVFLILDKV